MTTNSITIPSADFQRSLGAYLDEVTAGTAVTLTRYRRPVAVVVRPDLYAALLADRQELENLRRQQRPKG